jgi:cell division protein FtsA
VEPRVEELYSLVQAELRRSGYEELISSGVVLTGGSSVMRGMVELAEEIFHMPVRVGHARYGGALEEYARHPRYSTGVGLLLAGVQQHRQKELARMNATSVQHVFERMKSWFTGNF